MARGPGSPGSSPLNKVLPAVNPNAGLGAAYKKKLFRLVDEMHRSIMKWVLASYRANEPEITDLARDTIAIDAKPSAALRKAVADMVKQWQGRFDEGAEDLAKFFAKSAHRRTDAQLKAILKKAGWSVDFSLTRAQSDIIGAVIAENVALIKSIPQKYLLDVEGSVMRSVQVGRDVGGLAKELEKSYKITKRRAQLVSRDQNNKATSALNRSRQLELGIEKALWKHSHAGKVPRPTHLKNDGKPFDIAKGWWDPAVNEFIWPGQLVNCRCTSRSIIPGFKR